MAKKDIEKRLKVLFLSHWYPHREDAMSGLFVQKHAAAVSLFCNVTVLYIYADKNIKKTEIVENNYGEVRQIYVYYPFTEENIFSKIKKIGCFPIAYYKGFRHLRKVGFSPDIVHSNVLTRTVFMAYLYRLFTKTPYVITEHWTRLLRVNRLFSGFFRQHIARKVVKKAGYILPVSEELLDGIRYHNLLLTKYRIIENVVDTIFFAHQPQNRKNDKIQFLNITCFLDKAKNVSGLLRVIKKVSETRSDFEVLIIGTGVDYEAIHNYYKTLNIKEGIVSFLGEVPPEKIAEYLYSTDAVVQFSNYESAGVVVQEALVTGTPVISTKVGIATKYINEKRGILIEVGNEAELAEAINKMIDHRDDYKFEEIAKTKTSFSYETIGRKFVEIYREVLKTDKND